MLVPFAPTQTAKQIAAKLTAIGFSDPQAEAVALIYANQLAIIYALDEQGVELPEMLLAQLGSYDPDEQTANVEGLS